MSSFSGLANFFRIDRRPVHQIEDEIREELAFHIEQSTEVLIASGLPPPQARERALEDFGDVERIRGACRRVQLGDRIMLLRIQWIVIAVLGLAVVALGFSTVAMQRRAHAEQAMAEAQLREAEAVRNFLQTSLTQAQAGDANLGKLITERTGEISARLAIEVPAPQALDEAAQLARWIQRVKADPDNWREAIAVGDEIASKLEPAAALAAMQTLYPELSVEQRKQILKCFVFDGGHPMAVQILKFGVFDAQPSVRERAFLYLREYAFDDLSEWSSADVGAWYDSVGDKPLDQVLEVSLRRLVARLSNADADELAKQIRLTHDLKFEAARKFDPTCGGQLESAGLLAQVRNWSASTDEETRAFALRAAGWLGLDSDRLRSEVLSVMERNPQAPSSAVWTEYCNLVGRPGNAWATAPLVDHYRSELAIAGSGGSLFAPAMALSRIGDANAIPQMIGLLAARDDADNRYAIGYFGLRELTGVAWDESHDAQWWTNWWQQNQSNFPGVTNTEIPKFSLNK